MPSFTGERARKFWKAVAARDAAESLLVNAEWPTKDWDRARLIRTYINIFGSKPESTDTRELWYEFDRYISAEERNDKYAWLGKHLPF